MIFCSKNISSIKKVIKRKNEYLNNEKPDKNNLRHFVAPSRSFFYRRVRKVLLDQCNIDLARIHTRHSTCCVGNRKA